MKKGYYLSVFVCFNEIQNILNIKLRHDQTVALWHFNGNEVNLIRYWELERYSGYKQHPKALYNLESLNKLLAYLLAEEGLKLSDIIEIWGTKGIEKNLSYRDYFLDTDICFHSIAHLMTSLYYGNPSPFKDTILSLNLDAGPDSQFEEDAYDKKYYAGCLIKDGKMSIFSIESPAKLWSYAFKKFGLREGTLMALATAMETRVDCDISQFNSFKFEDIIGRKNAQIIVDTIAEYVSSVPVEKLNLDPRYSEQDNRLSAVMKIINAVSESIVCRVIDKIAIDFHLDLKKTILALAGGFSLNCPTNSYLLKKYQFKNYQIPPCTSDTGIAAGIGIAAFSVSLKNVPIHISSAYYGQSLKCDENTLEKYKKYIKSIDNISVEQIAQDIIDKQVIVWVNGNAEIGPRALGNRSLIADPRTMETKDKLNEIKKRQWWRPVAPVVMNEYGEEYCEDYRYSPNMLLNFVIKDHKKDLVPAIVHFDGTSRVQSVSKESNPVLYSVLEEFYKKTNIPVLCNTSLNDAGEPIINTLEEAILFALHKGLQNIYCNGKTRIVLKVAKNELGKSFSLRNKELFDSPSNVDVEEIKQQYNPFNLSIEELTYYFDNPNIFSKMSLQNKKDVKIIKLKTLEYLKENPMALKR